MRGAESLDGLYQPSSGRMYQALEKENYTTVD
jgi:hypothetical protein